MEIQWLSTGSSNKNTHLTDWDCPEGQLKLLFWTIPFLSRIKNHTQCTL